MGFAAGRSPFRSRLFAGLAALALGAWLACGEGGSSSSPPPLQPPTAFTASQGGGFDWVEFRWTPPAGTLSGYEAEGRIEAEPWQSLGIPIPPDAIGGIVQLDSSLPELLHLGFRLRSVRGSERSAWAEVTFLRTLRPPQSLQVALTSDQEGVSLAWMRGSTANTGTRLERARIGDDASLGAFETVAELPADATQFLDETVAEASAFDYRLTHTAGSVSGFPARQASPPTALKLPADLQTQSGVGAIALRWTNRSTAATALALLRVDGGLAPTPPPTVVAVLSPTTTTYLDAGLGAGSYAYALEVRTATQSRQTPVCAGFCLPEAGWQIAPLALPAYVRTFGRDGRWYGWENGYGTGLTTLYRSSGTGWESLTLPPGTWMILEPGLRVDDQNHPHAAYAWRDPALASGPMELRHLWHDGTVWQEEAVASRVLNLSAGRAPRFALAADGTPHLQWSTYDASDQPLTEHAVQEGGTWRIEPITTASGDPLPTLGLIAFQVARDGTAYLAYGLPGTSVISGRLFLKRRPPGGAWTEEAVPASGIQAFQGDPLVLLPTSGTQVDLVYTAWDLADPVTPCRVTALRQAVSWDTPVLVYALSPTGTPLQLAALLDESGRRLAVPEGRTTLHLYDPQLGGWRPIAFPASFGFGPGWFAPTGSLHLLMLATFDLTNPVPYLHFADGS